MVACKSEWLHKCDRSHQIALVKNICEGAGRLPADRLFYDGLHAVGSTNQRHVGATVGEQPHGDDAEYR